MGDFKLSNENVELSEEAQLCRQYELNSQHKSMVWGKMVAEAEGLTSEEWESKREKGEQEILLKREADGQKVRLKNGKLNQKCIFDTPQAYGTYRSAKSVIRKAFKSGIEIKPDMGKTAVERAAVTPDERVNRAIRTIAKNWGGCKTETRDEALAFFRTMVD